MARRFAPNNRMIQKDARMPVLELNGVRLNVAVAGEGRPLVMLHGLGSNIHSLAGDIAHFSRTYKVIAIDSRGHGGSARPESFTLADHVRDVLAVIDALSDAPVRLIGSSGGSYIAQGVATNRPSAICKLVLCATKAHGLISSSVRVFGPHAQAMERMAPEELTAFRASMVLAPDPSDAALRELLAHDRNRLPPEEFARAAKAFEAFDFRMALPKVAADTLVIAGHFDPLNPPDDGRECAALIPKAVFAEMARSGHIPRIEERDRYLELLDWFFDREEGDMSGCPAWLDQ